VRVLKDVPVLLATGLSKKDVARKLNVAPLVVDRALALQEMMDQEGITDPYRKLLRYLRNQKSSVMNIPGSN